jgi:hypothetical protein
MDKALGAIGYGNISVKVSVSDKGADYEFSSLPSLQAAREVATAFAALTKTAAVPRIMPRIETVSASLYAQARNRMVQIEVNGEGKTDEQIKAEIEAKLAAQGFSGSIVYLKTDSTGRKNINLQIEESDSMPGQAGTTIDIDTHGKTDDQIKAEVAAKMAAQGHPKAQINVHSEGADSTRKIELRIEDIDTTGH